MITLAPGLRVYLACGVTDMRKGMIGLAMLVQQSLAENPFDGAVYAFRGRRAGLIKLIWHDGVGLCMLTKRLERGQFLWPSTDTTGRIALSAPQLAQNDKLALLIRRLVRHQFGRRSEQLTADQLQLGLEDLEQTVAANQAAQEAPAPAPARSRAEQPQRNLGDLPAHLPRYEVLVDVESRQCPCCGGALHQIGETRSEQLDVVPGVLRVRVTRRPRYACRACEGCVVQAPAPERPIDGGLATEAMVAHVLISKYCDSLPLYRQSKMLARQGIALDRSTLSNWVGRACWWLAPLYDLVVSTALSSEKVFADDTTLPVLDPGRGKTKLGRLWCYAVDDRPWRGPAHPVAVYVYAEDRKVIRPAAHLAEFRGVLQVDGYAGFKRLAGDRKDDSIKLAFCWAHMRRPFYQFFESTESPLAGHVLARIRDLYAIEAEIRGHPAEYRREMRQARSRPIVAIGHAGADDHRKAAREHLRQGITVSAIARHVGLARASLDGGLPRLLPRHLSLRSRRPDDPQR